MAKPFILDVNLRIQQVLGLASVKQQLASVQTGGVGQVQKLPAGFKTASQAASLLAANTAKASKAVNTLGSSAKKTGAHLGTAAKKAQNFGDQIFLAGKRYGAFLAATVGEKCAVSLTG